MYLHAHAYTCIYGVDEPGDLEHGISAYTHTHMHIVDVSAYPHTHICM